MSSEINFNENLLAPALAAAGKNERLRNKIFDELRQAEVEANDPVAFREQVRWPLILSLLGEVKTHRVVLENGLIFEVSPDSRIERALLLSTVAQPDHIWEPQTTRLLIALADGVSHAIVGGAYIGDQVIFLAQASASRTPPSLVHAFEPMEHSFGRLLRNLKLNKIGNVVAHRLSLWERTNVPLRLEGHLGLASCEPIEMEANAAAVTGSIAIDDYVGSSQLPSVGLIMLDTEGGEEKALHGARHTIARCAPNIVFEIHRQFVDWTAGLEKTSVVRLLTSHGYQVFAIRDFHDNVPMADHPIEIIPVNRVHLEGPPHGFNVLATKDAHLVMRLGLRVVKNVSPKLLLQKDPALHHPIF